MSKDELATRLDNLANLPSTERATEQPPKDQDDQRGEGGEEEGRGSSEIVQRLAEEQRAREQHRDDDGEVDDQAPTATKKKVVIKKVKIGDNEYTLAEISKNPSLLQKLADSAQQLSHLTPKYQKALEQLSTRPPETPGKAIEPAKAEQPKAITDQQIATSYDPWARTKIAELIQGQLLEEDLSEAYPRALLTMIGQLRFAFDLLYEQRNQLAQINELLSQDLQRRNAEIVHSQLNAKLDELVETGADQGDDNPYKHLTDIKVRKEFVDWLRKKVNPETKRIFGDDGAAILGELWVAFHSQAMIEAAKLAKGNNGKYTDRRNLRGESGGTRPAGSGRRIQSDDPLGEALDERGGLPPI